AGSTQTLAQFYDGQVVQLGFWVQNASDRSYHNGLVAQALGEQRESVAGVSLDEEAANLIKAQRAYQAAARVMTVYDELLDLIINGMGVAGR
ncbi:MAG TPA: flagellar basal body rod C-terminal domain-containing protein, partial [Anaerolineaceae bacterium]|nr:flagellar basal body rod C-terminal domain-containing protein [Anaerolineaceae bacterium]